MYLEIPAEGHAMPRLGCEVNTKDLHSVLTRYWRSYFCAANNLCSLADHQNESADSGEELRLVSVVLFSRKQDGVVRYRTLV